MKIIIDVDNTLTMNKNKNDEYKDVQPNKEVLAILKEYKNKGWYIILNTSRNMKTFEGNIGKVNKITAPVLLKWLEKWGIEYDEIYFGKPWCGDNGFYVDDRAIRPSEFVNKSISEINDILNNEKKHISNNS